MLEINKHDEATNVAEAALGVRIRSHLSQEVRIRSHLSQDTVRSHLSARHKDEGEDEEEDEDSYTHYNSQSH